MIDRDVADSLLSQLLSSQELVVGHNSTPLRVVLSILLPYPQRIEYQWVTGFQAQNVEGPIIYMQMKPMPCIFKMKVEERKGLRSVSDCLCFLSLQSKMELKWRCGVSKRKRRKK